MGKSNRFSPEVRERAVRRVQEHRVEYPALWAVMESIAPKIGCSAQTLHECVKRHEVDAGLRGGVSSGERDRIKALKREAQELRRAKEILKLASAFFAQAELDRRFKSRGRLSTSTGSSAGSNRSARSRGSPRPVICATPPSRRIPPCAVPAPSAMRP
jgi:transposase-like protein